MNKQNKTNLQFIIGGILMATFAVAGCNNGEEKAVTVDSAATEMKTTVAPPAVIDSAKVDSMEVKTGDKSPTPGGGQ